MHDFLEGLPRYAAREDEPVDIRRPDARARRLLWVLTGLVFFCFSHFWCIELGMRYVQEEAAAAGVGHWKCDPRTGKVHFEMGNGLWPR